MEELIAKRYVDALFKVCDDIDRDLEIIRLLDSLFEDEKIKNFIMHPEIDEQKKVEIIVSSVEQLPKHLKNLLALLAEHKRLALLPAIAHVVEMKQQEMRGEYEGVILSDDDLDDESIQKLTEALKRYTGKEISLQHQKEEIDGLLVHVDDLGLEVNFSKSRIVKTLIDYIERSL